jgi:uncharacterized protein YbaR (Trm112 family)
MKCPHCKQEVKRIVFRRVNIHFGKYCPYCNSFLGWVKKTEVQMEDVEELPKSKELF